MKAQVILLSLGKRYKIYQGALEFFNFVDRASRYNSLQMTNLTHFFVSLFITPLYMFRASQCSSSGDRIVLIPHLV